MVKKEKYIDWLSVAIPETYVYQIRSFIQTTKRSASVAEYVRRAIDNQLKEDLKTLK